VTHEKKEIEPGGLGPWKWKWKWECKCNGW